MNNTKQKILNSCHNLFEKKLLNEAQLKNCLSIESDKTKKNIDPNTQNIINSKNLEYTKLLNNLKKKYKTNYNQYKNNRINCIKYPDNCLYNKRSNLFKNNLYKLNLEIRNHISKITNNYKDNKYNNQYTELISFYKDIEAVEKEIENYEKKLQDIIQKKHIYNRNQIDLTNKIFKFNIKNLICFIIALLLIIFIYKIIMNLFKLYELDNNTEISFLDYIRNLKKDE